jgi:hypothetical protein
MNSWVRCKTGHRIADQAPLVLVEQDINTLASDAESRSFGADQVRTFFDAIVEEAEEILRKYFPA